MWCGGSRGPNYLSIVPHPAVHKAHEANVIKSEEKMANEKGATSLSSVRRGGGPRTRLGKDTSKQNSLKHGIFSRVVVLKGESRAEFDALLSGLCDYFHPVGTFEEGLVETLAVTRWRQRRLFIAEAAEIEAGREFIEWDETQRQLVEAGKFPQLSCNGGLIRKIANAEVLENCLSRLRVLKIGIETNGFNPEKDISILTTLYGDFNKQHWQEDLFKMYQVFAGNARFPDEIRERNGSPSPEKCKKYFLSEIKCEMERLVRYEMERTLIESSRMKLEALRRSVPDSPRLDHLLRYAATLERTFDRTLNQLERAKRMRLGQPVLPPINVNVSS
jgi:hypothetical protein